MTFAGLGAPDADILPAGLVDFAAGARFLAQNSSAHGRPRQLEEDARGRPRSRVNPFEALGSWPSGEFLFSDSDLGLDRWPIFAALGCVALVVALAWWLRRGDVTLPAAFLGVSLVYVGTLVAAERYVQAKALVVPAAVIMLLIVGGLLAQQGSRWRLAVAIGRRGAPAHAVDTLPESVLVLERRDLLPALSRVARAFRLNILAAEALVAAEALRADIIVGQDTPRLRQACRVRGVTYLVRT